jgi:hypothetical protein
MVTHVIREQPFYILGEGGCTESYRIPSFFFQQSPNQNIYFHENTGVHSIKKITSNNKIIKKNAILEIIHYQQGVHRSLIIYFQYFGNELI